MGFLSFKRFFSLRRKEKTRRGEYGRPEAAKSRREAAQPPTQRQRDCYLDEHAAFRSKSPSGRRNDRDGDDDAAVSRLLRSSSANYHVVAQTDFADLPPLPHPINTIASRSTSALTLTPSRTASLQARGSYRVTVHKRQQLSTTVFPNAYPPQTPRRPGIAHASTPDLLSTYADAPVNSASTSTSALVDPRKVPVTPRDASRLNCLRQDPSVVSLVRLYDDHGRLAENAFTNTPAPPRSRLRVRNSRRKSTFVELLGCEGTADANLAWAESCIAQNELSSSNSVSNASTSSLSSASNPPLDSPATSTFNDVELDRDVLAPGPALKRDPSGSTITGREKDEAFSSLVVELSVATSPGTTDNDDRPVPYLGPYRNLQQKEKGKGKEQVPVNDIDAEKGSRSKMIKDSDSTLDSNLQDRTMGSKIGRRPSQRASQVFNFIGERRERRKSQELLQGSSLSFANSYDEPTHTFEHGESAAGHLLAVKPPSLTRAQSPPPLMVDSNFNPRPRSRSTFAAPVRDVQVKDPAPAPSSPVTLRPLYPAPRPNGRSRSSTCSRVTGAAMVRAASSASASTVPAPLVSSAGQGQQPAKGVTLHAEREKGKERNRAEAEQWALPQTSTPHPSKIVRAKAAMKVSFARHDRGMLGEVTNTKPAPDYEDAEFDDASFEKRYSAFAASLDVRTEQLRRQMREKENDAQGALKRRGATSDHGLIRSSTTTVATLSRAPATKLSHKHAHAYAQQSGPQTPIRSQSLRALEDANLNPPAVSSSELSPATVQLMLDLRARKAFLRGHAGRGKQATNDD